MKYIKFFMLITIMSAGFLIKAAGHFVIAEHVHGLTGSSMLDSFPYHIYLCEIDLIDINTIRQDIELLDSLKMDGGYILSTAFTEKFKNEPRFRSYFINMDSIARLIKIAEKYKIAAELDKKHKIFYESVWDDWLNTIANYLADTTGKNNSLRLNHDFIYLTRRLAENQHIYVAPPLSDMDKTLYHISESHWAYLMERFWTRTPWWFKTGLVLLGGLFIIGQIAIYKNLKYKNT